MMACWGGAADRLWLQPGVACIAIRPPLLCVDQGCKGRRWRGGGGLALVCVHLDNMYPPAPT
jgi:hypothetical protein